MVFLHHVTPCVAYANWLESYYTAVLDTWRMKSSGFFVRSLTNYTSDIVIFANIFYILSRWDTREEFWLLFLLLILFFCRHNNREYKQFDKSSFSSIKIVTRTYWNGPVPTCLWEPRATASERKRYGRAWLDSSQQCVHINGFFLFFKILTSAWSSLFNVKMSRRNAGTLADPTNVFVMKDCIG